MKHKLKLKRISITAVIIGILLNSYMVFAQTNGPVQIEYSKSSGGSGASVNEFTGGFSQSIPVITIPGPNGSDYSMSLTYQSGASPTEPASWVGFGWTLNAGAIVRQKRGFPDDYKDIKVKYWNKTRESILEIRKLALRNERFGKDANMSITQSNGFSNYVGYSQSKSLSVGTSIGSFSGYCDDKGNTVLSYNWSPYSLIRKLMPEKTLLDGAYDLVSLYATNLFSVPYLPTYTAWKMPTSGVLYEGSSTSFIPALRFGNRSEVDLPLCQVGTTITNTLDMERNVNGYFYNGDVASPDVIMDYFVEKDNNLKKSEKFLGIPIPNSDNYFVTGPIGGSFRAVNKKIPYFRPNYIKSHIDNGGWGLTGGIFDDAGIVIPLGVDIKDDYNDLTIEGWNSNQHDEMAKGNYKDSTIFKFYGEMTPLYYNDMKNIDGTVNKEIKQIGIMGALYLTKEIAEKSYIDSLYKNTKTMIDYNTFKAIKNSNYSNNIIYSRYLKENIKTITGISEDLIAEYSIVNPSGTRYNYGLPVFCRNERQISYGINSSCSPQSFDEIGWIEENHVLHMGTTPDRSKVAIGTESNEPYISTYLLTEIYTSDYVDVSGDGPSYDDIGGYTLFNYKRVAGDNIKRDQFANQWQEQNGYRGYAKELDDKWYKWRNPYTGLFYSHNSLSDYQDDIGSFSMGETEIYYLESIETKTHIAYFVTNKTELIVEVNGEQISLNGSGTNRVDCYEANHNEYLASGGFGSAVGDNKLEFLEKIVLLTKDISKLNQYPKSCIFTDLVKTTYFQYDKDYPVWSNQPNSLENKGKLTLKRIWSDNGEIKNYGVSPYEFAYTYNEEDLTDNLKIANELVQTPEFKYSDIDSWGYYQNNGNTRKAFQQDWVNQNPNPTFDPAAWNLKSIILPSGAELRIQFEQNDYNYVQNKRAQILLPINKNFEMDISAWENSIDHTVYQSLLNDFFNNNKLYYHILFGMDYNLPDLYDLKSEYIDGFSDVESIAYSPSEMSLMLSGNFTPYFKSIDFFRNNRRKYFRDFTVTDSYLKKVYSTPFMNSDFVKNKVPYLDLNPYDYATSCQEINETSSYIRIPVPPEIGKKGGGIRVKRMLTIDKFDAATEAGQNKVYGSEYYYIDRNGYTSGVASSEPFGSRHDNALVEYLDRASPDGGFKLFDASQGKMVTWEVKKQNFDEYIGPIGESVLPSPSVGYSNIFVKSIDHIDNSNHITELNGGITEKSFYTSFDYPFDKKYSILSDNHSVIEQFPNKLTFPYEESYAEYQMSQGYSFILNNMNGQIKSINTYKGNFSSTKPYNLSSFINKPTQSSIYNYFPLGSKIPIYNYEQNRLEFDYLGTEVDICVENKSITQTDFKFILDADIEIILTFPFFRYLGVVPHWINSTTKLKTDVTSKVVRYSAILKSVETIQDGVSNIAENIAYDRNTGSPIIVKSNDGFHTLDLQQSMHHDGTYHKLSIPANNVYKELGNKSYNQNLKFSTLNDKYKLYRRVDYNENSGRNTVSLIFDFYQTVDRYAYGPHSYNPTVTNRTDELKDTVKDNCWECFYLNQFTEGDIIKVTPRIDISSDGGNLHQEYYQVKAVQGNMVSLLALGEEKIMPCSKIEVDVYIVKSGRKNRLNESFADIATYGLDKTFTNKSGDYIVPFNMKKEADVNVPLATDPEIQRRTAFVTALNNAVIDTRYWTEGQTGTFSTSGQWNNDFSLLDFKDIDGNKTQINGDDIKFSKINDTRSQSLGLMIEVTKNKNLTKPNANILDYVPPFIESLNAFYTNLFSVKLNRLIPEIDWFNANSYVKNNNLNDPKVFSDPTLADRYQMRKIANTSDIQLIRKRLGYYELSEGKYEINGNLVTGSELISSYPNIIELDLIDDGGQNYVKGEDIFVILDQYTGDVVLSLFMLKFDALPIGVLRTHFNSENPANIHYYFKENGDYYELRRENISYNNSNYFEDDILNTGTFSINYNNKTIDFKIPIRFSTSVDITENITPLPTETCSMSYYWYLHTTNGFNPFYIDENGQIGVNRADSKIHNLLSATPQTWCKNFACLEFYEDYKPSYTIETGVLAASIVKNSNNWANIATYNLKPENSTNMFLTGEYGQWRAKENYVYKDVLKKGVIGTDRIYSNAGIFSDKFYLINPWGKSFYPVKMTEHWQRGAYLTKYSPYGLPLESVDILNNPNSVHYGQPGYNYIISVINSSGSYDLMYNEYSNITYAKEFVSLVASNAYLENCAFQSWEYQLNISSDPMVSLGKDKSLITSEFAHSGKYSRNLSKQPEINGKIAPKTIKVFNNIALPNNMLTTLPTYSDSDPERGIICKLWAKTNKQPLANQFTTPNCNLKLILKDANAYSLENYFTPIKQVGEWTLYTAELLDWTKITTSADVYVSTTTTTDEAIYIDDILIKPRNSGTQCFVYDYKKQRATDVLDDNHFAMHYQYNFEGNISRVMKETEIGMRTIVANSYNSFVKPRHDFTREYTPMGNVNSNINTNTDNDYYPQFEMPFFNFNDDEEEGDNDTEIKQTFDIFNFSASPDKQTLNIFNTDQFKVPVLDSLTNIEKLKPNTDGIINGIENSYKNIESSIDSNATKINKSVDSLDNQSKEIKNKIKKTNIKNTIKENTINKNTKNVKNSVNEEYKNHTKDFKKEKNDTLKTILNNKQKTK